MSICTENSSPTLCSSTKSTTESLPKDTLRKPKRPSFAAQTNISPLPAESEAMPASSLVLVATV